MLMTNLQKKIERQVESLIRKFYLPIESKNSTTKRISKLIYTSVKSEFYTSNPKANPSPYLEIPTDASNFTRLFLKLKMYQERFREFGAVKVVDILSEKYNKRPLYVFTENDQVDASLFCEKRFFLSEQNEREYLEDKGQTLQGYFLETYIINELNSRTEWKCPHCGTQRSLSLCIEDDDISESFRDAICLACQSLFEIKTKNESFFRNKIYQKKLIHGGDFVSINILLNEKKNIYIIIYNRDKGDIYCGKIVDCFLRENEKFLYSIQEGGNIDFGYPSSYVRVDNFSQILAIKAADEYITIAKSDEISKIVIDKLIDCNEIKIKT